VTASCGMPAAGDVVLDPPRPSVDELAQGLVLRVMAAGGVLSRLSSSVLLMLGL